MKVYYRVKKVPGTQDTIPYNYNIANALIGALQCGLEIHPYFNVNEIYDKYELGDIVLDGIYQVDYCLNKFGITAQSFNYPDVLEKYMGRKVWKDTINHISRDESLWSAGYFVKPIKEKAFTGKIISSTKDLIGCGSCYEDYEVLVSEPLDFVYECRGFVYYDELKDLRPYKGDFKYMKYMDTDLINKAMDDWKNWDDRPAACSLDFGVVRINSKKEEIFTSQYPRKSKHRSINYEKINNKIIVDSYEYKTVLIEGNLPYALGCYGLDSLQYIKLISAYISQISGVKDELDFR